MTEPYDPDTNPNPWRETVRDIYDMLHLKGEDFPEAMDIVEIIEERHPRYFGAEPHPRRPRQEQT